MNQLNTATLYDLLEKPVQSDKFWTDYLRFLLDTRDSPISIHLAIFVEPYLQYVLDGDKTIESRFSANRCPPFNRVSNGDVLLLKRSGGPIVGICRVVNAWFYELDPESWDSIRTQYAQALCAQDPDFWKQRQSASFASLMRIGDVLPIEPLSIPKKDRRGWVILHDGQRQSEDSLFSHVQS